MKEIKFLDLGFYNLQLRVEMQVSLSDLMEKSDFINGKSVNQFTYAFTEYVGASFGIPCGNGTDALEIIIRSLALPAGSSIVVPNNTFFASAEAVINNGHTVVLSEFDNLTQNLCPQNLRNICEKQDVQAVIFVHLYGNTAGIADVKKICDEYGILLIEDCAQAHGAKFDSTYAGNFGVAAAFSFYPGKVLGAIGDAGMIITNDVDIYDKCVRISDHGRINKFDHEVFGRNSRMDSIQAAYLSLRLKMLSADLIAREKCRSFYFANVDPDLYKMYTKSENVEHGNHLFPIRSKRSNRNKINRKLEEYKIPIGCHYPRLLSDFKLFNLDRTLTEDESHQNDLFSLPIGPHLDGKQLSYISSVLNLL